MLQIEKGQDIKQELLQRYKTILPDELIEIPIDEAAKPQQQTNTNQCFFINIFLLLLALFYKCLLIMSNTYNQSNIMLYKHCK